MNQTARALNPSTGWEEKEDAELLAHMQGGSRHAFGVLVRRHSKRFYGLAWRLLGNPTDAEDAVQEAFLKLWERPELWQAERGVKFTTWFYRIVTNQCLDMKRRKTTLPIPEEMEFADPGPGPEAQAAALQEQRKLNQAIAALPERQRVALALCFYEQLSNQDAAEAMGLKLKALQSLLMRAKATLKATFDKTHDQGRMA